MNIFLACTSSGAIAGWAVWRDVQFLWASLIAASQVVNAVKSWIPYSKRLKALSFLSPELHALALVAERDWFDVADGSLTDQDIHKRYMELKAKKLEITKKALAESRLPENEGLVRRAAAATEEYFSARYGG